MARGIKFGRFATRYDGKMEYFTSDRRIQNEREKVREKKAKHTTVEHIQSTF